jgi:hypothetical protein
MKHPGDGVGRPRLASGGIRANELAAEIEEVAMLMQYMSVSDCVLRLQL